MIDKYVYLPGDPACKHDKVTTRVLTVDPPIYVWKCSNSKCSREIRQRGEVPTSTMPDMPFSTVTYDDVKYAKVRRDGDLFYRTAYIHDEEEETPEEFEVEKDVRLAYDQHRWYQALYEVEIDMEYNLRTGMVKIVGVQGVKLERPVVL